MKKRCAICLVVDGLRASAIGAYGNTSYPTPFLDGLASQSLLVDWLWADSPELEGFYRSVWDGRHCLRPRAEDLTQHLPQLLGNAGIRQWLATDDPWLCKESLNHSFDESLLMESEVDRAAPSFESTGIAQLYSETIHRLNQWHLNVVEQDTGIVLWVHSRGLMAPWDAPSEFRDSLLEEGDPRPECEVVYPDFTKEIDDPDVLYGYRVAYAAQVAVLDSCLGAFMDAVKETLTEYETMMMVFGSRGYALGEHRVVGNSRQLYGECLHLPCFVHVPSDASVSQRCTSLTQPFDLGATILDWFGLDSSAHGDGRSLLAKEANSDRHIVVSTSADGTQGIRTPAWFTKSLAASVGGGCELYAKPDDRWEYNDVASLCPEVVESLKDELSHYAECAGTQGALPISPGNSDLVKAFR